MSALNQALRLWLQECNSKVMPHRILIVDDDEQIVASLREYLVSFGYEVNFAYELEEAQTLLNHFNYEAVVTDLCLTRFGFSGLEIIKQVREGTTPTHVVVLTGHGWPELEAEASANGVCAEADQTFAHFEHDQPAGRNRGMKFSLLSAFAGTGQHQHRVSAGLRVGGSAQSDPRARRVHTRSSRNSLRRQQHAARIRSQEEG